jgi:GH24 family phage-related lysozyme (muramidase)
VKDSKEKPLLLRQVCADLVRHEDLKLFAYPDPLSLLGKKYRHLPWGDKPARELLALIGQPDTKGTPWTVGVGHTHGVTADTVWTKEQSMHKLEEHVIQCAGDLERVLPEWKITSYVTQTVLLNLMYNLGAKGFSEFRNTMKFIKSGDYALAAKNLQKSLWYKQVGHRGKELVTRLSTQAIPDQFLVAKEATVWAANVPATSRKSKKSS